MSSVIIYSNWSLLSNKDWLKITPKVLTTTLKKINKALDIISTENLLQLEKSILSKCYIYDKANVIETLQPKLFKKLKSICMNYKIHFGILIGLIVYDFDEDHYSCSNCKGAVEFFTHTLRFQQFCSRDCANVFNQPIREASNLEKYGHVNVSSVKEFKENRKNTHIRKYGVENSYQSEIVKCKIKKTLQRRYGIDHPMESELFKCKQQKTCLKNHGVRYPMQSIVVRDKSKQKLCWISMVSLIIEEYQAVW